jgi:hypothetical protein
LPARLVDLGDDKGRKRKIVGEKLESLPRFHIEIAHSPQGIWVCFDGVDGGKDDGVIGSDSGGLVHWVGVAALEQDVGFGAHDEEGRAEREDEKPLEI